MPHGNYSVVNGEGYKDQYIIRRVSHCKINGTNFDSDDIVGIYDTTKALNIALNHLYRGSNQTYKIQKVRITTSIEVMSGVEKTYLLNAIADKGLAKEIQLA